MNRNPIDEYYLLAALPGFSALTEEEKGRITVIKFEYEDYPCIMTTGLQFEYKDILGRKMKLTFEMAGNRKDGHFYSHVLYDETGDEMEFPDFRKAIDFCNQHDRPAPNWEELSNLFN